MSKEPFKVGDRVKMRGFSNTGTLVDGACGTVSNCLEYNLHRSLGCTVGVTVDETPGDSNSWTVEVCVSQLIRLKPRRKPLEWNLEQRTCGATVVPDLPHACFGRSCFGRPCFIVGSIHVREVLPKKGGKL